jgi:hypothetical protein
MAFTHFRRGLWRAAGPFRRVCLALVLAALLFGLPIRAQDRPALPLTATFTSEDGRLTFAYPGGWFAAGRSDSALLGSSAAALDPQQTLPRGDLRAGVYVGPASGLDGLTDGATLEDVMRAVTVQGSRPDCPAYSAPEALTVADRPGLRASQTCSALERLLVVVAVDANTVAVVSGATLVGSMDKFASTLVEVAASARFIPPPSIDSTAVDTGPLTETFVSASGDLRFRAPSGWRFAEEDGVIGFTDGPGAIFPQPPTGQLAVRLRVVRADALPPEYRGNPASAVRWLLSLSTDATPYGQPASFRIADLPAARARGLTTDVETLVVAVQLDAGTYALLSVLANPGTLAEIEPLLYALATTIEVSPDADLGTSAQPASTPTLPPPTPIPGAIAATFEPLAAQDVSTVGVALGETYLHARGTFGFQYPAGWLVRDADIEGGSALLLTPDPDFAPGLPAPGEPFAYLVLGSLRQVLGPDVPVDLEQAALAALPVMASGTSAPYGSVAPMRLDGRIGASMVAALPDVENTAFIVLLNDDVFAYMSAFFAPGDLAVYGPGFLASLSSVTVETGLAALPTATAAPVTATVTPVPVPTLAEQVSAAGVSVRYPAGWTATEANGVLTLSSVASLDIVGQGDDLNAAPGQTQITLMLQPADERAAAEVLTANAGAFATGAPYEIKGGKWTALAVPIDVGVLSGTLVVLPLDDQFAIVTAFYNPADAPAAAALLRAMLETVE